MRGRFLRTHGRFRPPRRATAPGHGLPWLATLALGAAAWLGGPAVAEDAAEPVTLYFWGNELDIFVPEVLRDFEAIHDGTGGRPRIHVVMGQSATVNKTDDPQRLLCAVAGGDPPDVVWFDRFAVGEWAARGAFLCLQDLYERDLVEAANDPYTFRQEQFFEPCWQESMYNGRLYGIPSDTDNRALYYSKSLLRKYARELIAAGCVDEAGQVAPPRTWAQLEAAARIMTERDAAGKLVQVGFIPNYGNSWLYIYGWLNGAAYMSGDGRRCLLNAPEVVEGLAYMTHLYDVIGGAKDAEAFRSTLQTGDLDPFLSGKVAMKIDGDFFLPVIAGQKRDLDFGVAPAPAPGGWFADKPRFGWCGGWAYVVPATARHPEEAWLLIKYLVSQRAYRIRSDVECQMARAAGNVFMPRMSSRKDVTQWAMEHYLYSEPAVEEKFKAAMRTYIDILPVSKYRPVTAVGQLLWNEHIRAMEAGIYKRFDAQDIHRNAQHALDLGAARVQRELDRVVYPVPYPELRWRPVLGVYGGVLLCVACGMVWHFRRRMHARGYFRREYYAGYLFASPWFLGFVVFGGGPLVFSLLISFCQYDVLSPPQFVGLANYAHMFEDPLFYKSLWNTVFMALAVPIGLTLTLGIALLLNLEVRGIAWYRTLFYLPAIMPAVAASLLWIWIFNPQEGILNALLAQAGVEGPKWLQDQAWSKPALIIMVVWGSGGSLIIWLAGLKGIPKHLYEAAEIDGAGAWRKFVSVTLPMLSPYILFNLIMGFIGTFQIFTQAFVMTQGGPVDSTLFYVYYLFNNAFRYLRMGYASALAWVLFAIVLLLTVLQLRLSRHLVYYETDQ